MSCKALKFFLLIIILSISRFVEGQNNQQAVSKTFVSITGNGYMYPSPDGESSPLLRRKGIVGWSDSSTYCRVFFNPRSTGKLVAGLNIFESKSESQLQVTLDGRGKAYKINIGKSDSVELPIGQFDIPDTLYHFLEIRGLSRKGVSFPSIRGIVFSGEAAVNLVYNKSEYRGAPSTHLRYPYPEDSTIAWFYNEIEVPVGVNAVHGYYMTNGFADGYMGIQTNSYSERRFIFSIWSNYNTNNPKEIPADYAVRLLKKGKDVVAEDFGNEGSGGHSHLVFPWKNGTTYKFLVGVKPLGDHTIFSGYYFTPEDGKWHLISQWDKAKTGGKQLSRLYSFVENFGPNGNDYFKADYGNQWVRTAAGTWIELTKCSLTTTASAAKHQRYDFGAGVENNRFYMYSGGFQQMNNLAPKSTIERKANGTPPDIDFSSLPTN